VITLLTSGHVSVPDHIAIIAGAGVIQQFASHPHSLALLPAGVSIEDVGEPGHRFAGVFLIDADCAGIALNDDALDRYIRSRTPVFIHAARARDLRPFLRRREQFRRRGVVVEVLL
jgi:hypothetical protein